MSIRAKLYTSCDHLAFVANKAIAGGLPRVEVIADWSSARYCGGRHTVSLFQKVGHKVCFTRVVES